MKIEFDRIGLPGTDLPLSAKMIAVSGGYKVDREGKIKGKGHATRDIVEWLLPPLWPWKILTLANRGPRPTLKGETRVTLRLMEDVIVPESAQYQRFGRLDTGGSYTRPALYLRPRTISPPSGITAPAYRTISWQQGTAPADHSGWRTFRKSGAPVTAAASAQVAPTPAAQEQEQEEDTAAPAKASAEVDNTAATTAVSAPANAAPAVSAAPAMAAAPAELVTVAAPAVTGDTAGLVKALPAENTPTVAGTAPSSQKPKVTLFALRAGTVYAASDYWRDDDRLVYVMPNGKEGQVAMDELDWKTTTQLNADRSVKVTLRDGK